MWQYWKKFEKVAAIGLLIIGLSTPLLMFLNRVLEPDVSCDSLNYHLYLGFKGWNPGNNKYEFFPSGAHNFSPILEMVGYGFYKVLGYRLGTIFSIIAIYISIFGIYKIIKLILPRLKIRDSIIGTFLFVSSFLSFELFLGIGSYFNDGLVAMLTIWSVYYLLKYFQNNKLFDLVVAAGVMSISVLGKQTNVYMAVAMGLVLIIDWLASRTWLKFRNIVIAGVIILYLPGLWFWQNWKTTGNPIFPFYNAVFKSEYAMVRNLVEPELGGQGIQQKLLWGYYSIFETFRLGQVHDLFHDFKINFYFIFGLVLTIVYVLDKKKWDKLISRLLWLYWSGIIMWSLMFGYLRYALALEYLGGLIVMIMFYRPGRYKYILFIPAVLWLLLQNKRVINMSLAYDISFRPGFYYNQNTYKDNLPNLFNSRIEVKNNIKSEVYLNCWVTGMTYYVLSPFNKLPVANIDKGAYGIITDNEKYMSKQPLKSGQKYVTIAAKTGLNAEYNSCINNLREKGYSIDTEEETEFVGDSHQKLGIIWGTVK